MESELFGHEKGAFTGATSAKMGLVRAAEGGTLFLDEIGELPPSVQVKLLRVLQERRVRPVGGSDELEVDVRVIAATNRDLEADIASGRFRQDLFYRLNVIRIEVPPLRDRPEDIPLFAEHFLAKYGALMRKRLRYAPEALRWICEQPYPGNVRELENVVERAVTLAVGPEVGLGGLDLDRYLGDVERQILLAALAESGGVRKAAAKRLGMTFRSFRYRLAKYDLGLDAEDDAEA
jgi:two-component system response regulator PilR (NtrC family)